jgi:hypothetical protein
VSTKKPVPAPKSVVADDPDDRDARKGRLKNIGGSRSDHWNNLLANQTVQALWLKNSSPEEKERQYSATIAALIGIAPKDELEGMVAAQLIAAHNAAMECYRRAMIGEQTFEGRRENLAQANKRDGRAGGFDACRRRTSWEGRNPDSPASNRQLQCGSRASCSPART